LLRLYFLFLFTGKLSDEEANGSLRISLSRFTTEDDVKKLLEKLPFVVEKLRSISPFGKLIED